ncbi:hypothetical protein FNV43_RR04010 [Rhamnella rubrinervis]|uniref:Receptor-like serine/threonine-protein kinase n=1 Tax=Rhamnella rubrinervis TaxID=2594499 RepID=A0A8K0HKX3_9ROSA|nr:hypothetical protein FNV43_RR04010 [Rhamnella rubrinervis]
MYTIFYALFFLQFLLNISYSSSLDTITPTQSIADGQTLVSSGQSFVLGFFSRSSNNWYLGIWYKTTPDVLVWVANRNNPLNDSYGALIIINNGNLVLMNQNRSIIWSSNSSTLANNNSVAKLLETGNLIVGDRDSIINSNSEVYAWQSFDHPTDTFLAGMKIGWNFKTGIEQHLASWKCEDDPSAGPWNGVRFSGSPNILAFPVFKPYLVSNEDEVYYSFRPNQNAVITQLKVNPSGLTDRLILYNKSTAWSTMYTQPYEPCDYYGYCGANGICRINRDPLCECLQGFNPWSEEEWNVLNYSSGCVRKTPLDCRSGDGFVKLDGVKFPDFLEFWSNKSMRLEECEEVCLRNCSCAAYANFDIEKGSGCMIWFGDLIDVRELRVNDSVEDIYLRLPASEISYNSPEEKTEDHFNCFNCYLYHLYLDLGDALVEILESKRKVVKGLQESDKEDVELPLFDLATIASATNNFSTMHDWSRRLWFCLQGTLITGQEIAVKRLSKNSGQGFTEFRNEVELIAKLQHRNLVSLSGCCIQAQERMLIYEYMPNRSLDHFIFDNNRSRLMGWKRQFDIIMGIARGLLYLHRDSKLHIIHRDLKASNILLDINFNPKISDFGLARIFRDDEKKQEQGYGYMSPEYAIDGKFSVKSDVFSFGVLLLEIVSGKRNRRFNHPGHHHNLLGHAWLLWNEGKALDLMDECLEDSCIDSQVVRCIQVGLLCVQKFPQDRPTMSSIVYMLENEEATLPRPKQPGFSWKGILMVMNQNQQLKVPAHEIH